MKGKNKPELYHILDMKMEDAGFKAYVVFLCHEAKSLNYRYRSRARKAPKAAARRGRGLVEARVDVAAKGDRVRVCRAKKTCGE